MSVDLSDWQKNHNFARVNHSGGAMWWYDFGIAAFGASIKIAALWKPKAGLWSAGRRGLFERMAAVIKPNDRIVWIHASSLGEFEQGRPLIEEIRRTQPRFKILLTFFSPSGYEVRKSYQGADYVFYLPLDTRRNACRFLDIVKPEVSIFVKYDFWLNFLAELRRRKCRTYLVSSIFRSDAVFFKPYGGAFRKGLRAFDRLFVQDTDSAERLSGIGIDNVTVAGDTRFDRVARIAAASKNLPIAERFAGGRKVFVAGSTWPQDEELLGRLAADNPDVAFIVAPHETDRQRIESMRAACPVHAALYTECVAGRGAAWDALPHTQILIVDTVGILSSLYRFGRWGYIGGGFGAGIHNTLEAAVFGLPLAFGPNWRKFREAADLLEAGAACCVADYRELSCWFAFLKADNALSDRLGRSAADYVASHCGATALIMDTVFGSERG